MLLLAWLLYRLLPSLALGVCLAGIAWRLLQLGRTPVALAVPLWPAPRSRPAWLGRLLAAWAWGPAEGVGHPLWRLVSWLFHLSLLALLLAHLRLLVSPVPPLLVELARGGGPAGWALLVTLVASILRRLMSPLRRRITSGGHWLLVGLLLALAVTGLGLHYWRPPDLLALKRLTGVPFAFPPSPPSRLSPLMGLHLLLGLVLVAVFPFSRLVHGLWLGFSPVRGRWRPRRQGLSNPWDHLYRGDQPSEEALRPGEPGLYTLERYREHLRRLRARGQGEGPR